MNNFFSLALLLLMLPVPAFASSGSVQSSEEVSFRIVIKPSIQASRCLGWSGPEFQPVGRAGYNKIFCQIEEVKVKPKSITSLEPGSSYKVHTVYML